MSTCTLVAYAVLSLGLAACSSSDDPEQKTDGGGRTPADGGGTPGDPNVLVGGFQVTLSAPAGERPGATTVVGRVNDGPTPATVVYEQAAAAGACTLFTPRVPFCETPCGGSAACVEDDTCQAYPKARNAGDVKVTGLHTADGATELTISPIASNYQLPAGVTLAYPPCSEGEAIKLEASGGDTGAFTLESKGIAPLELSTDAIPLAKDTAVHLTWTAPGQSGVAKISVKLDISHHGGSKGMITCEAADSGALEIPATLATKLLDLGVAGFPTIVVTRSAVGSATISAGRVDLVVSSAVERGVEIEGLHSCNGPDDCPPEKPTCRPDLLCE